jgi:hypothetical protein
MREIVFITREDSKIILNIPVLSSEGREYAGVNN